MYENTKVQTPDHIAGFIKQGTRYNKETKQQEPAAFLEIYLFDVDKNNEPIQTGTYKMKKGKEEIEVPNYKILRKLRVPISSLNKVVTQKSSRCQVYYSEPKQRF